MNNSNKISAIVIIILAITIVFLMVSKSAPKQEVVSQNTEVQTTVVADDYMKPHIPAVPTDVQKAQLKAGAEDHQPTTLTFDVTGGSFYFTPNEIIVRQGDKVKINFTNVGGTHNLLFVDFGEIGTKTIKTGESDTIEFMATKKGTFEFYCGVGNGYHRMMGQIGVLIVK